MMWFIFKCMSNSSGVGGQPIYPQQQQQQQQRRPQGPAYTEDDFKQCKEMFPNMDDDVIKSVLESNSGNKDSTINALLQMSAD